MKGLALIGSTGSIGVSALEVVEPDPESWRVVALACGRNVDLLADQIRRHNPHIVSVADSEAAEKLAELLGPKTPIILIGEDGLRAAAKAREADTVLVGVSGARGMLPAWEAIRAGKRLALATKEAMVLAGDILIDEAKRTGAQILPVDSEHSAVFQLLQGVKTEHVARIWLGASGGPFRKTDPAEMEKITPEQALAHPVWKMGPRITIDSATMMNKGLEIIEACRLFGVTEDKVGVFVHPQGLVHAMVELKDGVMLAHVSKPDMKGPIAYALYYPDRPEGALDAPELLGKTPWTFEKADPEKFPCLELAREAVREGGTMPAVMNAADEVAVEAFLDHRCSFTDIPLLVKSVMDTHEAQPVNEPTDALKADGWARIEAEKLIEEKHKAKI